MINVVKGIIQTVLAVINGDWGRAWEGIKGVLSGIWNQMLNIVSTVFNLISSAIGGVLSTIAEVWRGAWGGIRDFLSSIWSGIKNIVISGIQFVVEKMGWMAEKVLEAADFAFGWIGPIGDKLNEAKGKIRQFVDDTNADLERIKDQEVNVKVVRSVREIIEKRSWGAKGDGPGGPIPGRMGRALSRVQSILPAYPGTRITSTYRSPWHNRAVGGSPTSHHLDRANPAVDIGGPTYQLDRIAAALRQAGGWREGPIWRSKGHYDHVHVAHRGELVGAGEPGWRPGLSADERLRVVQVGERIIPATGVGRGGDGASSGEVHIHYHIGTFVGSDERAFVELAQRAKRKGYVGVQ